VNLEPLGDRFVEYLIVSEKDVLAVIATRTSQTSE
jgi:hypothetical protein